MIYIHGEEYRVKDLFKKIRLDKGLTQIEFSKLIGIEQGNVSSIEIGKTEPLLSNLQSMMSRLGYEVRFERAGHSFHDFNDLLDFIRYENGSMIKNVNALAGYDLGRYYREDSSPSLSTIEEIAKGLGFKMVARRYKYSIARHIGPEYEDIIVGIPDEKSALDMWRRISEDIDYFDIYKVEPYDVTAVIRKEYDSMGDIISVTVLYHTDIGEYEMKKIEYSSTGYFIVFIEDGNVRANARRLDTREEALKEIEALKERCIFGKKYHIVEA